LNPGDVIWIEFPGVAQTKRRPAVILSSFTYHATRPDIIVGLITSQISKSTSPTDYLLRNWQPAGLRLPSAFRAFIITLPRSAVIDKLGTLAPEDWQEVVERVKLAMELK
jgi:mRNA interferase MazF